MKMIILCGVLTLVGTSCFAESNNGGDEDFLKLSMLLESHSYRNEANIAQMTELSKSLPAFERLLLYEKYKTSGWWCLLNLIGGLGSWVQGDYINGGIVTGTMITGSVLSNLGSRGATTTDSNGNRRSNTEITNPGLYYSGITIELPGLVYGLWAPWDFEAKDSKKLRGVLSMAD